MSLGWGAWSVLGSSATPPRAATAVEARQQEILKVNIDKAGDPELDHLYARISASHFAGALPPMAVRWEPRLAEVGALAARTFTLEGMFGHVGGRTVILLNPDLQYDKAALERALCHEIVHAYLFSRGKPSTNHGPEFQAVLHRLSDEGAFEGVPASVDERTHLRAWLDAESARLEAERTSLERTAADLERERLELERDQANLTSRIDLAGVSGDGRPDQREVDALNRRRDAYNLRALEGQARVERNELDTAAFDREARRYNLMLAYPDGINED